MQCRFGYTKIGRMTDAEPTPEGAPASPPAENRVVTTAEAGILRLNSEDVKQRRAALKAFVDGVFEEGVHFVEIGGYKKKNGQEVKGRRCLTQPGAQELIAAFGLTVEFLEAPSAQLSLNAKVIADYGFRAAYEARAIDRATGLVVASGVCGECNSFESKYHENRAPDWTYQNKKMVKKTPGEIAALANTMQKMGQKRALVAVALLVTGASAFFTQDIEDKHVRSALGMEREAPASPAVDNRPDYERWPATEKQTSLIATLCKKDGIAAQDLSKFVQERFGHPYFIPMEGGGVRLTIAGREAGAVIDAIKNGHLKPAPEDEVQTPPSPESEVQAAPPEAPAAAPEADPDKLDGFDDPTSQALAEGFQARPEAEGGTES